MAYEGTYIDLLPLELQDRIGVPPVVGRLLTLPLDVVDMIYEQVNRLRLLAPVTIQKYWRGANQRRQDSSVIVSDFLRARRHARQDPAPFWDIFLHRESWMSRMDRALRWEGIRPDEWRGPRTRRYQDYTPQQRARIFWDDL